MVRAYRAENLKNWQLPYLPFYGSQCVHSSKIFSRVLRQEYAVRRAELLKDAKDRTFQLYDVQPSMAS